MIKKYQEYYQLLKEEAGIQNIKKTIEGYTEFEIWFHQDLDGVTTALAMKSYLEGYGLKCINAHIIQYGGLEYAIKRKQEGVLAVLVDFAHLKPMFHIATDHHENQAGQAGSGSTSFKHARSNVETISGMLGPEIFDPKDVELIKTVDSADFHSRGITPQMVQNSIFKFEKSNDATTNRFMMGFVVNRLLLAYKNKRLTVTSLDGKFEHTNKNILECLVMDCSPSLYSMFNNIRHYINSAKTHDKLGKLATPETLAKNLEAYMGRMKTFPGLKVDDDYGIAIQYGGGTMFDPGSYDRYTVFKNNPDIQFNCIVWPMGLIQVSCNPFKEKLLKEINLGAIAREVLDEKYKAPLSRIMISVWDIKKQNEIEIEKKVKEEGGERVGFTFKDLVAFYNKLTKHQPNVKAGDPTVKDFDLEAKDEFNEFLDQAMSKLHGDVTDEEKQAMRNIKISAWDAIMANSGGHPSITNISGISYLAYRKDGLMKYFNTDKYTDLMKMIQNDVVNKLKEKIDATKQGKEVSAEGGEWGMGGISEDAEYFVSKNGSEMKVSKDDFIKMGVQKHFSPKMSGKKGFSVSHDGNKIIAKIDERKKS
jgi:hypothetical protein